MLTPIELQNRQLKTGRGYSKKEADIFLQEVNEDYEALYRENMELRDKIGVLSEGIQYYKTIETTLQKALVLAEKASKETKDAAYEKAGMIEKDAMMKAEFLEQETRMKIDNLEKEAVSHSEIIMKESESKAEALEKESIKRAELLEKTAKDKSDYMLKQANNEFENIQKKSIDLVQQYNQFKYQLKKLASTQLEMLEDDFYDIYSPVLKDMLNDSDYNKGKTNEIEVEKEEKIELEKEEKIEVEMEVGIEDEKEIDLPLDDSGTVDSDLQEVTNASMQNEALEEAYEEQAITVEVIHPDTTNLSAVNFILNNTDELKDPFPIEKDFHQEPEGMPISSEMEEIMPIDVPVKAEISTEQTLEDLLQELKGDQSRKKDILQNLEDSFEFIDINDIPE